MPSYEYQVLKPLQSITAETGAFTTVNGLIKGHFRSTSSLKLTTTNLAIDADVELFGGKGAAPSELIMTTTNAYVLMLIFVP